MAPFSLVYHDLLSPYTEVSTHIQYIAAVRYTTRIYLQFTIRIKHYVLSPYYPAYIVYQPYYGLLISHTTSCYNK